MKTYINTPRQQRITRNRVMNFFDALLWHSAIAGIVLFVVGYNYFLAMRDAGQLGWF